MQLLRKRQPYTSRSAAQPPGAGGFRLRNHSEAVASVRLTGRLPVYDQGLADLTRQSLSLAPGATMELLAPLPGDTELAGRAWILASLEIEGFPVTVCEAQEMKGNR